MKTISVLFLVGILLLNGTSANGWGTRVKGYIILNNDDILKVDLNIPVIGENSTAKPNFYRMQMKVNYFDSNNNIKNLYPRNAKEVYFEFENASYRMLSRRLKVSLIKYPMFLHLRQDGKVKLFAYYKANVNLNYPERNNTQYGSNDQWARSSFSHYSQQSVLGRENERLLKLTKYSFEENTVTYFSDCPQVVEKIKEKFYSVDSAWEMVNEYNKQCDSSYVNLPDKFIVPFSFGSTSSPSMRKSLKLPEIITVKKVLDGFTFITTENETVRLIGIGAPDKGSIVKRDRLFAEESQHFLDSLIVDQEVKLVFDVDTLDENDRTLAYVFLIDSVFVNEFILEKGMAYNLPFAPNLKYAFHFKKLENKARKAKIGLWNLDTQ